MRPQSLAPFFVLPFSLSIIAACGGGSTVVGTGADSNADAGPAADDGDTSNRSADPAVPPESTPDGGTSTTPPPAQAGIDAALIVPGTAGGSTSTELVLSQLRKMGGLAPGSCPTYVTATDHPYVYVEVRNTTSKSVLTSIWASLGSASTAMTVNRMAIYAGGAMPVNRGQCLGSVVYSCSVSPCAGGYAGFSAGAGHAVEIPAGQSTVVYVSGDFGTTGSFTLNVRSELFY